MNSHTEIDETVPISKAGGFAEVREDATTGHRYLVSTSALEPGETLCLFSAAEVFAEPDRLTIQTGHNRHISLLPHILTFTNHSCAPNIFFDTEEMRVLCLEPVLPGDELTFFYPSTELEMAHPFSCHCGAAACIGEIKGAARLAPEVLGRYRLTRFVREALVNSDGPPESSLPAPPENKAQ